MMRRPARRAGRPWQGARAVYIQGMTQAQYYGGNFLLALPGMEDMRFDHSVVALCVHDGDGALGITVCEEMDGLGLREHVAPIVDDLFDQVRLGPLSARGEHREGPRQGGGRGKVDALQRRRVRPVAEMHVREPDAAARDRTLSPPIRMLPVAYELGFAVYAAEIDHFSQRSARDESHRILDGLVITMIEPILQFQAWILAFGLDDVDNIGDSSPRRLFAENMNSAI